MAAAGSKGRIFRADAVRAGIPGPEGERHAVCLRHGSWTLELYEPEQEDRQQPHNQDECYVILEGSGMFAMGDERQPFAPGDMIFVPAGLPHRFEAFGERVRAWVVFAGPQGGSPQGGESA